MILTIFRHADRLDYILQKKVMNEILRITGLIQLNFPAQYEHLNETPLFLAEENSTVADFERYLESLKTQLSTFEKESFLTRQ